MGFLDDWFGAGTRKRVTKSEFADIKSRLYNDFDKAERHDMEKVFHGELSELGTEEGLSSSEVERGLRWLRENMSKHALEENDIALLEECLNDALKD